MTSGIINESNNICVLPKRWSLDGNEEEEKENDCCPIADRFDKLDGMGPLRLFEDKSRVVSLGRRPI